MTMCDYIIYTDLDQMLSPFRHQYGLGLKRQSCNQFKAKPVNKASTSDPESIVTKGQKKESPALSLEVARMPMDALETDTEYILVAELPGFSKEDIHIGVDRSTNVLTIRATPKKPESTGEEQKYFVNQEIFYGVRERSIVLPDDCDLDQVTLAEFVNGLLKLQFGKKKEQASIQTISIN